MRKIAHIWIIIFVLWMISFFCFDLIYATQNKKISQKQADKIIQKVLDKNFHWLDKTYKQKDFLHTLAEKLSTVWIEDQNIKILQDATNKKISQL